MKNLNFATNWNSDLIESQYSIWLNDAESLDSDWRAFFEGFDLGQTTPLLRFPAISYLLPPKTLVRRLVLLAPYMRFAH